MGKSTLKVKWKNGFFFIFAWKTFKAVSNEGRDWQIALLCRVSSVMPAKLSLLHSVKSYLSFPAVTPDSIVSRTCKNDPES